MCDENENKGFATTISERFEKKEVRSTSFVVGTIGFLVGLLIGAACSSKSQPATVHYHAS